MSRNPRVQFFVILSLIGLLLSFTLVQSLFAQDDTLEATNLVTIEGPVQSIGGNAITISGINIQVNPNDPAWVNLQVGDVVRVQANSVEQDDDTVVLVAVIIIIVIDVDTATPTPEATSEATPEATPDDDDDDEATPEVTPEATPEATPETTPDPDDVPVIIVIEGPVQAININIITIYNINIQVDADDPILTVIQIGDIVRIAGNIAGDDDGDDTTIVIIAVTIVIINVDVVILDGVVWRDSGNCNNPPPSWAPANGWRRRCEIIVVPGGGNGGGNGGGRGMGGS
jgi:hypothetical protein